MKARIEALGLSLLLALPLALGSCSGGNPLQRALRPNAVSAKDKSSLSEDELAKAIARYADEAERRKIGEAAQLAVDASFNLGTYRLELGRRYIAKQMFRDAYDVLALASKSFPDDPVVFYNAGLSAAHVGKSLDIQGAGGAAEKARWLEIAKSSYDRSISLSPKYTQALYGVAVLCAFELGQPSEAARRLNELLAVETRNVDAMLLLARCYVELGKLEDAANLYETAAKTTVVAEKRQAAERNRAAVLEQLEGKRNGR